MSYSVYILHSLSHDKFYIGQTNDLKARILSHNFLSTNSYTSKYRPWILHYSFEVHSRSNAMALENYLKKKPRTFLIRIKDDVELQNYIIAKLG